jgi:glutamate--cysteine ligase
LAEVRDVAERIGAGFIGLGVSPDWRCDEIPVMPKGRYGIMRRYMQEVGSRGLDMMFRSCTIQVNLDFESEADMVKKLRVAVALQPIATALFASSPFFDGAPSGFSSTRSWIWRDVDNARTGMLPFVFEDGFGFERWADYALDVPMYFVYRNGQYLDASGQSFRHFLEGTLPAAPGEIPTLSDWADHLTTIFPEARIKKFMEMRGADGGPWRRICALPALWVGLLYDQTALDAAWDLVKGWTAEERETLRDQAGERGLAAKIRGQNLQSLSGEILKIAEHGLTARAQHGDFDTSEAHFLNDLKRVVESGETMADEMLRLWRTEWDQDFSALYRHYAY